MNVSRQIKRPSLRYYGGGWNRAPWTISFFPQHDNYLEPCFGAGSILARKPRAKLETVNDINGRVVNFFRVLRERPQELIDQVNLTPWARDELQTAVVISDDPLEDARRFFIGCWVCIKGGPNFNTYSFRINKSYGGRFTSPALDIVNRSDLMKWAKRLGGVQIESYDAIPLIEKFADTQALIYFDPPYLLKTRSQKRGYTDEPTPAWHRLAAAALRQHDGAVVVSGYPSRLYERMYQNYGWRMVTREFNTNGKTKGQECLWLNPCCLDLLASEMAPAVKIVPSLPLLQVAS